MINITGGEMNQKSGQLGFSDAVVEQRRCFLDDVDALIDWKPFEKELAGVYNSARGRPSYPQLALFKTLLLQQWYGLSDPAMEEALADRISFRRFTGLSLHDNVPDHSTICRFRAQAQSRLNHLLDLLNLQFEQRGFLIKEGTMMDASFVKAASSKNGVDPDAGRYGRHPDKSVTGYKEHMGVDKGSGLVRRVIVTPANVNDTTVADDLVMGDEAAVYADKAYDKDSRREWLTTHGIFVGIMHRPGPTRPLTAKQVEFNKAMTKVRAPVERVFAVLKLHYRLRRSRYIGLLRTTAQVMLAVIAMNIKRGLVLATA
jgi:IS5 family transposase